MLIPFWVFVTLLIIAYLWGVFIGRKTKEDKKHDEILELKKQLERAILEEAYEEAATLRDKINELEKAE